MLAPLDKPTRNARLKSGLRCWFGPWQWSGYWHGPSGHVGSIDLRSLEQCGSPGKLEGFGLFALPSHVHPGSEYELASGAWRSQARLRWQSAFRTPAIDGSDLRSVLWETMTRHADPLGDDRCRPLVPTTNRQYEIWLTNQRIVLHPFRANGAAFRPVLDALKREYRQLRRDSLDGRHHDRVHYLRCLDYWREKYGVSYQAFIPSDLPDEGLVPHETVWTETWPTDSTTISSGQDQPWTEVTSDQAVSGGKINSGGTARSSARCNTALSSSDNYCQAVCSVTSVTTTRIGGPCCRYSGSAETSYSALQAGGASNQGVLRPYKTVAGAMTALGTGTTQDQAATKKIQANGTTLDTYQNGVSVESITDSAIATGLHCGVMWNNVTATILLYDNFEAGDVGGGGGPVIPVFMAQYRQRWS